MSNNRPNFIVFLTDQHRADLLGCQGHPVLQTPHIDSIAKHGVRLERFYVANPACMPNRASLLTGRASSVHGVRSNGLPLPADEITFLELMRDAGYATALIGKAHLQNYSGIPPKLQRTPLDGQRSSPSPELCDSRRDHRDGTFYDQEGPRDWASPETRVSLPYYGFDEVELATGHGDMVEGNYLSWALSKGVDVRDLRGSSNALPHNYSCPQAWRTAVPASVYPTAYIAEKASDAVDRLSAGDQPFFLLVSFPDPHHPFTPPGHYWDMYNPSDMPEEWAYADGEWSVPPHVQATFDERISGRAQLGGFGAFAVTEQEAKEAHALACGMVTCIDDAVGRVLAKLRESDAADSTIVAFTSDHGDFLGDHRLMLKGPAHYDSLIRVPFIWADPLKPENSGMVSNCLASSMDLAATVLNYAQIAPPWGMQGKSLLPLLTADQSVRDSVVIEDEQQRLSFGFDRPARVHTLVTSDWRLSVYRDVEFGELYNLVDDPLERINRWNDKDVLFEKTKLLELLLREQMSLIDQAPFPTASA